jgi:hypothetical protein
MNSDDIKAQIARVDEMIERCEAVARRAIPIKPDMSLPRYQPQVRKVVVSAPERSTRPEPRVNRPPVSWEPQQRFEEIRRAGGGYRPLCGHGYGDDVDRAFEECSNAPY